MSLKTLIYLCLILFGEISLVLSKAPNAEIIPMDEVAMQKMHKVTAPSLSNDNLYAVFPENYWDDATGKVQSNLKYTNLETKETKDLTTIVSGQKDTAPLFSTAFPNHLFFTRSASGKSGLYYMKFPPTEGDEPVQLTSYPISVGNYAINKNTLMFSADMLTTCETMQCTADNDKKIEERGSNTYQEYTKLMVRHWDFWYKQGYNSHPFYQKLKLSEDKTKIELDGEPVDMLSTQQKNSPPIENGPEQFSISNNEKFIAFSVHEDDEKMSYNTKWDIYVYNVEKKRIQILTGDLPGRCQNPKFNDDDTKIAFLCMDRAGLESDALHIELFDLTTNEFIKAGSTEEFLPTINDFRWIDSKENIFLYSVITEGHTKLIKYEYSKTESPYTELTNDDYGYGLPVIVSDTKYIMLLSMWTSPNCIGLSEYNEETKLFKTTILYDPNEETKLKYDFTEGESFKFAGGNGETVQGWIFKPASFEEGKKYPLIFLIHGGPESAWKPNWSFSWSPQAWTNRGYAVTLINPHGSMGMGIKFQDAVRNDWGGVPFEDIMLGWDYINATYSDWIDMNRVGACGASYGGYMVNWIQGNNDDKKFKVLVTHDGVFSTITMFYATEEMWFPMAEYCPHDKIGCKPWNDDERPTYEKHNPEYRVDHWNTPHLIIHGTKDYRIPISEGVSAFTALQLRGVPSKFLHFPEENHWVLKAENSVTWFKEVFAWLDKYLENN